MNYPQKYLLFNLIIIVQDKISVINSEAKEVAIAQENQILKNEICKFAYRFMESIFPSIVLSQKLEPQGSITSIDQSISASTGGVSQMSDTVEVSAHPKLDSFVPFITKRLNLDPSSSQNTTNIINEIVESFIRNNIDSLKAYANKKKFVIVN